MTEQFENTAALRIRRHEPTRLEGFVDSSFAFAVTLLVISIGHVPDSVPEMMHALRGVPAFAACFSLIARIWQGHRFWGRHYDIEDGITTALSLVLVFLILIYVYPLRFLVASSFSEMSGGWLGEQPIEIHSFDELRAAYIVFGIGYAAIALVFVALYRHAFGLRQVIGLNLVEIEITKRHIAFWFAVGTIAVLSCLLAAILPFDSMNPVATSLSGCCYFLIIPVALLLRRHYAKRIATLSPTAAGAGTDTQ